MVNIVRRAQYLAQARRKNKWKWSFALAFENEIFRLAKFTHQPKHWKRLANWTTMTFGDQSSFGGIIRCNSLRMCTLLQRDCFNSTDIFSVKKIKKRTVRLEIHNHSVCSQRCQLSFFTRTVSNEAYIPVGSPLALNEKWKSF